MANTVTAQEVRAMAVGVASVAIGVMFASMASSMTAGLAVPVEEPAIEDLRRTFGSRIVNEAVKNVGKDDVLTLANEIEKLFIADMKKKYGDWQTVTALASAPPGDLTTAKIIAATLSGKGITQASSLAKTQAAVSEGKSRGRQKAKPVKDTKTGITYHSKASAGMAVAAEYGLDPTNHFIWYAVIKKDPERFVEV